MEIYREGREIMLSIGNVNQWKPGYPPEESIRNDIAQGWSHVIEDDGVPVGAFAFIPGKDPTYARIEGGQWIEDTLPYGTIHRLASTKTSKGIARACFEWCWERIPNLRIDTHKDNAIMLHCIAREGFSHCGTIYLANGEPRLAFQKIFVSL